MKRLSHVVSGMMAILLLAGCLPTTTIKYDARETAYLKHVDEGYAYDIATRLLAYRTNPKLGYRTAGSNAEHEVAGMLAEEMKTIGLTDVQQEPFTVDSWTF